jgi:hypothetical protein
MMLVTNWKSAWRWFSVQAMGAIVALPLVWAALPGDAKSFLPDGAEPWVLAALAVAGIMGRLIDQSTTGQAKP